MPTVSLIFELNEAPEPNALEVTAVGKQWWWQFDYPAANKGDKKVVTANEMHVPVGREVNVSLSACDASLPGGCNVIHSFWVPELNGKRDVVPGHDNKLTFTADKPGTYLGQCAEYCGLSHANMRFRVIAQIRERLQGMARGAARGSHRQPSTTRAKAGELFGTTFGCTNCHTTEDSSISTLRPEPDSPGEPHHLRERLLQADRANLIDWILDAPS